MSCSKESSELAAPFCRAARCSRWTGVLLLVAAFLAIVALARAGLTFAQGASNDVAATQKITGHLTAWFGQLLLVLALWKLGASRLAAARHADARARTVRHLEALLAGATDEAERRDLRARLADVAAPRSGCCK
ncbi:MAG: hypothetical protein ACO3ND_05825 [Opitutales bacterium]